MRVSVGTVICKEGYKLADEGVDHVACEREQWLVPGCVEGTAPDPPMFESYVLSLQWIPGEFCHRFPFYLSFSDLLYFSLLSPCLLSSICSPLQAYVRWRLGAMCRVSMTSPHGPYTACGLTKVTIPSSVRETTLIVPGFKV